MDLHSLLPNDADRWQNTALPLPDQRLRARQGPRFSRAKHMLEWPSMSCTRKGVEFWRRRSRESGPRRITGDQQGVEREHLLLKAELTLDEWVEGDRDLRPGGEYLVGLRWLAVIQMFYWLQYFCSRSEIYYADSRLTWPNYSLSGGFRVSAEESTSWDDHNVGFRLPPEPGHNPRLGIWLWALRSERESGLYSEVYFSRRIGIGFVQIWIWLPLKLIEGVWRENVDQFDFAGTFWLILSTVFIMFSLVVITLLILGAIALAAFGAVEHYHAKIPVIPLRIFNNWSRAILTFLSVSNGFLFYRWVPGNGELD
ncbi:hypothetical protein RUND412_001176 [Rhizina undulata]